MLCTLYVSACVRWIQYTFNAQNRIYDDKPFVVGPTKDNGIQVKCANIIKIIQSTVRHHFTITYTERKRACDIPPPPSLRVFVYVWVYNVHTHGELNICSVKKALTFSHVYIIYRVYRIDGMAWNGECAKNCNGIVTAKTSIQQTYTIMPNEMQLSWELNEQMDEAKWNWQRSEQANSLSGARVRSRN